MSEYPGDLKNWKNEQRMIKKKKRVYIQIYMCVYTYCLFLL